MPDLKISELELSEIEEDDVVPIARDGANYKLNLTEAVVDSIPVSTLYYEGSSYPKGSQVTFHSPEDDTVGLYYATVDIGAGVDPSESSDWVGGQQFGSMASESKLDYQSSLGGLSTDNGLLAKYSADSTITSYRCKIVADLNESDGTIIRTGNDAGTNTVYLPSEDGAELASTNYVLARGSYGGNGVADADLFAKFDGNGNLLASTVQGDGTNASTAGFRGLPQNLRIGADYTIAASDNGKHLMHPSADTTPRTFTINSNTNLALPIGFNLTIINQNGAGIINLTITSDTLRLAGSGSTGSRSIAANGVARLIKINTTEWIVINDAGVT